MSPYRRVGIYADVERNLNICGNNILDPCKSFPLGIKVGDRIRTKGDDDEPDFATVVSREEWDTETAQKSAGCFTDNGALCAKEDEEYRGRLYWRNGWNYVTFLERPIQEEESGQLLMF